MDGWMDWHCSAEVVDVSHRDECSFNVSEPRLWLFDAPSCIFPPGEMIYSDPALHFIALNHIC